MGVGDASEDGAKRVFRIVDVTDRDMTLTGTHSVGRLLYIAR